VTQRKSSPPVAHWSNTVAASRRGIDAGYGARSVGKNRLDDRLPLKSTGVPVEIV
jgi:hypothetical protein